MSELTTLVDRLANASAVRDKISIRRAYEPTVLGMKVPGVRLGDDCAALPDGDRGYLPVRRRRDAPRASWIPTRGSRDTPP